MGGAGVVLLAALCGLLVQAQGSRYLLGYTLPAQDIVLNSTVGACLTESRISLLSFPVLSCSITDARSRRTSVVLQRVSEGASLAGAWRLPCTFLRLVNALTSGTPFPTAAEQL